MGKIAVFKDLANVKIETERLVMRPVALEFAPEIFKEFTEEITTYMTPPAPQKVEDTESYIRQTRQKLLNGTDASLSIFKKDTGEFCGGAGMHDIDTRHPKFGIWIKKSAHGNKYGQEAVRGLYDWVNEHLDFGYIIYPVVAENTPSRKIAELLGGRVEKEYDKTMGNGLTYRIIEYHIPKLLQS